jgi:hypothetical protein
MSGDVSAYVVEPMYQSNVVTVVVDYARAPGGKKKLENVVALLNNP